MLTLWSCSFAAPGGELPLSTQPWPTNFGTVTWGGVLAVSSSPAAARQTACATPVETLTHLRNTEFVRRVFQLDGLDARECKFVGCSFIYRGGTPPQLHANAFVDDCTFAFDGAAANTLALLTALYHGGLKELVETTLANIRSGRLTETRGTNE